MPEPVTRQYGFPLGLAQYIHAAGILALVRMVYGCLPPAFRQYTLYHKVRRADAPRRKPLAEAD